jgi:membrane protein implicated in regulation of membrane protease activity
LRYKLLVLVLFPTLFIMPIALALAIYYGGRVGMLYAGFLESPLRNTFWQALAALILFFVALMLLFSWLSVKGAKPIFKPLEKMMAVVRSTRQGEARCSGAIVPTDEIGVLAQEAEPINEEKEWLASYND